MVLTPFILAFSLPNCAGECWSLSGSRGLMGTAVGEFIATECATNTLPVWMHLLVVLDIGSLSGTLPTPPICSPALLRCGCCCSHTGAILQFVRDTTTRVEGVGDVCSLAVFDFDRHGNRKYGALAHANKRMRSKQVRVVMHSLHGCTFTPGPPWAWCHPLAAAAKHRQHVYPAPTLALRPWCPQLGPE